MNILKLPLDMQGNGQLATYSQGRKRTSDGDPRTGTFHQTQVTTGNTTCSVKGVYKEFVAIWMEQLLRMKHLWQPLQVIDSVNGSMEKIKTLQINQYHHY